MKNDFEENKLYKYKVNIFIDNESVKGSPVLYESNPTYYNLFGKIEKNIEHGTYYTDFTMIRPGAIQKANGGYLLLHALDLFKHPQIWETLKRVIRSRKAFIEDLGEQVAMIPTSGLKPEPIDLKIKVILFGTGDIYQALTFEDEEFSKLFKVKIDFDYRMKNNLNNISRTVDFIDYTMRKENLLPFHASGYEAILEASSRYVDDQRYLSTDFSKMKDMLVESSFYAAKKRPNKNPLKKMFFALMTQLFTGST